MQCVRHLLVANCWLGWLLSKSDLQGLEISRRLVIHLSSHSGMVFVDITLMLKIQLWSNYIF